MNLSDEVDLEDFVSRPDKISAAEISAVCQEAGMHAVRKNRWEREERMHEPFTTMPLSELVSSLTLLSLTQVRHPAKGL